MSDTLKEAVSKLKKLEDKICLSYDNEPYLLSSINFKDGFYESKVVKKGWWAKTTTVEQVCVEPRMVVERIAVEHIGSGLCNPLTFEGEEKIVKYALKVHADHIRYKALKHKLELFGISVNDTNVRYLP